MLIFGHVGLTLGLAWGLDQALSQNALFGESKAEAKQQPRRSRLDAIAGRIDYRLVIIGSMLPDIIDKPIGIYIFGSTFDNGRIFSHTLLFLAVLLSIGLYRFFRQSRTGVLVLAFGCGMHLFLDGMWSSPRTLFWPVLGTSFEHKGIENFLSLILDNVRSDPSVYVPEIIGFVVLILFGYRLLKQRHLLQFMESGLIK